jgi:hypothetical protein
MKHESKQKSQEQEQLASTSSQQVATREFATAEELLRHESAQTEVPPVIADRLTKSIQNLPPPSKSWWQRLLKR